MRSISATVVGTLFGIVALATCPAVVTAAPPVAVSKRAPRTLLRHSARSVARMLGRRRSARPQQKLLTRRHLLKGVAHSARPGIGPARPAFIKRLEALSFDPAHGGQITKTSRREGYVGAMLEYLGRLPGPLRRERTGKSEFVDARGQQWDVKAFNSKYPKKQGGFSLSAAVEKLKSEFGGGENVILDTQNLSTPHRRLLDHEITRRGWSKNVIWFP